jgi:threonine aldolase
VYRSANDQLSALAAAPSEVDADVYGGGGDVAELESEVAELLGKPAAAFVPSGTMAQQCALRVWCDATAHPAVGVHGLSHLVLHEEDALEELHGIRLRTLTRDVRPLALADLSGHPGPLGALVVELPLRDAGYLLPTWDELVALTSTARERGIPVHFDGARLWEAQPYFGRDLAEVAALADTVYVSFYKGLGGPAGAAVAGSQDAIDQIRQWRHRHGGTLFSSLPYAVAARAGLRSRLGRFGELAHAARERAAVLGALDGVRIFPDPPQTNSFVLFVDRPAAALTEAALRLAETEQVWTLGRVAASEVPGWSATEFIVQAENLDWSAEETAELVRRVLELARDCR